MIIIKKIILNDTDRELVAVDEDDNVVATVWYSTGLEKRRTLIDAEDEIEESLIKRCSDHLILWDY